MLRRHSSKLFRQHSVCSHTPMRTNSCQTVHMKTCKLSLANVCDRVCELHEMLDVCVRATTDTGEDTQVCEVFEFVPLEFEFDESIQPEAFLHTHVRLNEALMQLQQKCKTLEIQCEKERSNSNEYCFENVVLKKKLTALLDYSDSQSIELQTYERQLTVERTHHHRELRKLETKMLPDPIEFQTSGSSLSHEHLRSQSNGEPLSARSVSRQETSAERSSISASSCDTEDVSVAAASTHKKKRSLCLSVLPPVEILAVETACTSSVSSVISKQHLLTVSTQTDVDDIGMGPRSEQEYDVNARVCRTSCTTQPNFYTCKTQRRSIEGATCSIGLHFMNDLRSSDVLCDHMVTWRSYIQSNRGRNMCVNIPTLNLELPYIDTNTLSLPTKVRDVHTPTHNTHPHTHDVHKHTHNTHTHNTHTHNTHTHNTLTHNTHTHTHDVHKHTHNTHTHTHDVHTPTHNTHTHAHDVYKPTHNTHKDAHDVYKHTHNIHTHALDVHTHTHNITHTHTYTNIRRALQGWGCFGPVYIKLAQRHSSCTGTENVETHTGTHNPLQRKRARQFELLQRILSIIDVMLTGAIVYTIATGKPKRGTPTIKLRRV